MANELKLPVLAGASKGDGNSIRTVPGVANFGSPSPGDIYAKNTNKGHSSSQSSSSDAALKRESGGSTTSSSTTAGTADVSDEADPRPDRAVSVLGSLAHDGERVGKYYHMYSHCLCCRYYTTVDTIQKQSVIDKWLTMQCICLRVS